MTAPVPAATARAAAFALALIGAGLSLPAQAQAVAPEPPASDNGRYAMTPTPEGFLRLDTRTGKTSLCVVKDGTARCALAADEREAYEREIATLRGERDAARAGKPSAEWTPRLPSDQEIDRTLGVMEKLWRGLNRIIGEDPPKGAPL